jgi:ubiquitin-large subunit ribosomal protein L40e
MKIFVRTLTGSILNLKVEPSDQIKEVKQQIEDLNGLLSKEENLVFAGKHLDNEKTLADYGITEDSMLNLVKSFKLMCDVLSN